MRWIAVTVVSFAFVSVGAGAIVAAAETPGDRPSADALRNCASRGEIGRPSRVRTTGTTVQIGRLVLEFVRDPRAVAPIRDPEWSFAAKAPVLLPARSRVVLAIAPEALTRAAFQHRGRWVSAVRFTACSERVRAWSYPGTVGRTTFFPFGIALAERSACIPMELWVDGRSAPVRRVVPVGRRGC